MIKDDKEFLAVAMKAYENPSCVDIEEFYNLFGSAGTNLLLYKIKEVDLRTILIPFILYLGHANEDVLDMDVNIDEEIVEILRSL
jgi:hypothetical protein